MRYWMLLAIIVFPLAIGSCNPVPPPVDQGPVTDPQPAPGKVLVPAGFGLTADTLRAITNVGEAAVAANGSFQAQVISSFPSLVPVVDAADRVVFLGYLTPSGNEEIGAHSTAVVLLYFALGGWTIPQDLLPAFITEITNAPATATLAGVIEAALVANPAALQDGDPAINAAVTTAASQLSGSGPAAKNIKSVSRAGDETHVTVAQAGDAPFLTIDPPNLTQSGIQVTANQTGDGIIIHNALPRPAVIYVLQVAYEDVQGNRINLPVPEQVGTPISLVHARAIQPNVGINQLLETQVLPEERWQTATSDPVLLPLRAGSSKTIYKVVAIGPAIDQTEESPAMIDTQYAALHDEWRTKISDLRVETFVFRFMLPIAETAAAGMRIGLFDNEVTALFNLQQIVQPVLDGAGVSLDTMEGYKSALGVILDRAANNDAFRNNLIDTLLTSYNAQTQDRVNRTFMEANLRRLASMGSIEEAVQNAFNLSDLGGLIQTLRGSKEAVIWTVDIGRVRINPVVATITRLGPSTEFTAIVSGSVTGLKYTWSTTGANGRITTDIGDDGLAFTTTASSVQYLALPANVVEGELDRINVEVFDANNVFVGAGSARVEGAEAEDFRCEGFSDSAYNSSELLTLEISPATVLPGGQVTATVTYNFSHPLAESSSSGVTVYCSRVCGFCDAGQQCFCTLAEERRVLVDGQQATNVDSSPVVTDLAKTSDRPGLQLNCYASVGNTFIKPQGGGVVTKTFTFTINEYWAPCPADQPGCTCPVFHAGTNFTFPSYTGLFVVATASRLQQAGSLLKTTEAAARAFQFGTGDPNSGGCD